MDYATGVIVAVISIAVDLIWFLFDFSDFQPILTLSVSR